VKVNHRLLLDGIFELAGVPPEKFRAVCSSIDKLDKMSWTDVKNELCSERGLSEEVADQIGQFVTRSSVRPMELLVELEADDGLTAFPAIRQGLMELRLLFRYADALGCLDRLTLDLSLARGLDYYTGPIFEAVLIGDADVGSIAGGGRYDNLVPKKNIPCVGFSIGIERLFTIMEKALVAETRPNETDVIVATFERDEPALLERLRIVNTLRMAGIKAETLLRATPKIRSQLNYANSSGAKFAVIFGQREMERGTVQVKDLRTAEETELPFEGLLDYLHDLITI
jgi:histidyl-tRNA synthetase